MTRVAIAHDYLTQKGGAERVVLALSRAFPDAPIYTTLYNPPTTFAEFSDLDVRPSWLNGIRPLRRSHRAALPLLPLASSMTSIDAEVVVASSSGWAHGFRTSGRKLVYCYAPARWLYEPQRYLGSTTPISSAVGLKLITPVLKVWDKRAARTADKYLAISSVTQERIRHTYSIDSAIVAAPVSIHSLSHAMLEPERLPSPGFFLVVSRLLPYKNVEPIVRAFSQRPELRLLVIGSGPQQAHLVGAAGENVTFLEGLSDGEMHAAYARCAAVVAASHEDFGLTPLEAAAFGKPAIALRWGGFLDTVLEGETGVFFEEPTTRAILGGVDDFLATDWDRERIMKRAREFDEEHFISAMRTEVSQLLEERTSYNRA